MTKQVLRSPEEGGGAGAGVVEDQEQDEREQGAPDDEGQGSGARRRKEVPPEERANITPDKLNSLIDRKYEEAFTKAEERVRGELLDSIGVGSMDELQQRLKHGQKQAEEEHTSAAIREALDEARKQWEAEKSELERRVQQSDSLANKLGVESALIASAGKAHAYDPDDVIRALSGRLRINRKTGTVEVLTESGNVAIGGDGDPLTVDEAVAQLRAKKPHLFRDSTAPGTGEKSGSGGATEGQTITRAEFERLSPEKRMKVARVRKIVDG